MNIKKILNNLPVPLKDALLLKDADGLSYEQIAKKVGSTKEIIADRVHQARSIVAHHIKRFG